MKATHIRFAAPKPTVRLCSLWLALLWVFASTSKSATNWLEYAPAPPDNPLKGFVTYPNPASDFPHSLVWNYLSLRSLMTGPTNFDWEPLETELDNAARQGRQFIPRLYLDFPGKPIGIPQYLIDAGVPVFTWTNYNNDPFPPALCNTPDYNHPLLRAALTNFIAALGARYDRDPRLAYLPMGLLGLWGEWHNHPRGDLFASKTVQTEVMDAYLRAFKYTRVLARYPVGSSDAVYAPNNQRYLGYHDDSFAWATIDTGRPEDSWFFQARLFASGTVDKWRGHPIGGEVRPEVWDCLWNDPTCAPPGQEFTRCATNTHATWLANNGVFQTSLQGERLTRALAGARLLGYEFHVRRVVTGEAFSGAPLRVSVAVTNSGIAPFYYDWPLELGVLGTNGALLASWPTPLKLTSIQPGAPERVQQFEIPAVNVAPGSYILALRVVHPLANGKPLRFANAEQDRHRAGWVSLGELQVAALPWLQGELVTPDRLRISIRDGAPGPWRLEYSNDLSTWDQAATNAASVTTIDILGTRRFFRLIRQE
jgi:hypothetical protein